MFFAKSLGWLAAEDIRTRGAESGVYEIPGAFVGSRILHFTRNGGV